MNLDAFNRYQEYAEQMIEERNEAIKENGMLKCKIEQLLLTIETLKNGK